VKLQVALKLKTLYMKNIEAEKDELVLQNESGTYAIIPANKREEVKRLLSEGCYDCIDRIVESLPKASDYAEDGSLFPGWDKVKTMLNPYNWGVSDYTDKYSDKDAAFSAARKAGEKEYLYNGIRYTTDYDLSQEEIPNKGDRLVNTALKMAEKKVDITRPPLGRTEFKREYRDNTCVKGVCDIYKSAGINSGIPDDVYDNRTFAQNYKDYGFELIDNKDLKPGDVVQYYNDNIAEASDYNLEHFPYHLGVAVGNDEYVSDGSKFDPMQKSSLYYYDDKERKDPFLVYRKTSKFFTDKELSELDPNKKNFNTLALQKELANRGYDLSESIKKDGSFDGIWGDETKSALLDYQSKNNKIKAADGLVIDPPTKDWRTYSKEFDAIPYNLDKEINDRFINRSSKSKLQDENKWIAETKENIKQRRINEKIKYIADKLIENNPQGNMSRVDYLEQFGDEAEDIIKTAYPKFSPTLWQETARGLESLTEANLSSTINNIANNKNFTSSEKADMLLEYSDNPIMAKAFDNLNSVKALDIAGKLIQSIYKEDYSSADALQGKQNNAGIVEEIVTDPLNVLGLTAVKKALIPTKGIVLKKGKELSRFKKKQNIKEILNPAAIGTNIGSTVNDASSVTENIKAADGLVVEPPDLAGKLLNTIGGIESNNQYDIQYGGKRNPDLLNMTIDEVLQYQQGMKTSSAVGKYQFINKTLNDLVNQGYVTSDTKFTPETQDMLATKLLERRGLNKYLRGELTSDEFADNLSKEWAALPYNTNKSYYDKDGINKALISREDFMTLFADELNTDIAKQEVMQEQPASKLPVISLQEDDLSDYGIKNDVLQPITQDTMQKLLNPTELVTEIAEPEPSQLSIPDEVKSGLMSMLIQMKYISPGEKLTTDTLKMFVFENLQNLGNFPTDDQSLALITTELNK
jgi:muramidase (phage lysozyme)